MAGREPVARALSPADLVGIVGDDEDVKRRVSLLCKMVLEDAIKTMLSGDPASRSQMTRLLLPTVTKMMVSGPGDETNRLRDELKAAMEEATT